MFYHISEENKELYIHVDLINYFVKITSPCEDIYDRKSPNVKIEKASISFFFLDCIYRIFLDTSIVTIKDKRTLKERIVKCNKITSDKYMQMSQIIDRYSLLIESAVYAPYSKTIKFVYRVDKSKIEGMQEYFPIIKELSNTGITSFEKMKQLLFWLSDNIKHNGQMMLPHKKDAISLYKFAKKNGSTLNCRGLAIILCELCLALNLKARYIVCSQKELKYSDSHVVTICYSKIFKKWVYLDPCYKMYLIGEDQTILSLQELKEYIVKKKNILINQEANYWGNTLEFNVYREKMIKKLYKFASPKHIYFGMDNDREDNLIYLVPDESFYPTLNCTSDYKAFWK